jgi:hypothetical protein
MDVRKLDQWHKTRTGYLVFGVLELAVAYGLVSLAINDGNVLVYILFFIVTVGGAKNLVNAVRGGSHGKA